MARYKQAHKQQKLLLRIQLMASAKMGKEVPPEHIMRASGNSYKQNKKKCRILLKELH